MFTKEQFIHAIQHETHICKHLFSKIPEGQLEYRPTEGQRSILELLQYLTTTVKTPLKAIVTGDWENVQAEVEESQKVTIEQFCDAMDEQAKKVASLLESVSEEDLLNKDTETPMGTYKMGEALVIFPLKFIAAYRMQLFLYLKSVGCSDLSTYNCWAGIDKPQP